VLIQFPTGELYYGSTSLVDVWKTLTGATFDEVNLNMVNPLVYQFLTIIRPALPYIGALAVLAVLLTVEMSRWRSRNANTNQVLVFTRLVVMITVITLLIHWLAFHTVHLLLPRNRTGLFFVPLLTLAFGGALAVRLQVSSRDLVGLCGIAVLMLAAFYFVGCLRLTYFKEWKFDADTKTLYWLAEDLHRRCSITNPFADWRFEAPLNFYREAYGNQSLHQFTGASSGDPPIGRQAYMLSLPEHEPFIKKQGLKVIYHNDETGAAVAIKDCSPNP